ncbi:MAG: hypothetical protein IJT83_12345, partial [Victivallales bacterium]|nr:hypothetical protein [Victivallales bacterium]
GSGGIDHAEERKKLANCFETQHLKWLDVEKKEHEKSTWFMHRDLARGYAIDFCAATPSAINNGVKLEYGSPDVFVGCNNNGRSASDHIPLILTIS